MTQEEKVNNIRSLVSSARRNADTLDEALRYQLLNNIDQVFHINSGIDPELLELLKTRQETLVAETLRRVIGRTKSIKANLDDALRIFAGAFPQEKKG